MEIQPNILNAALAGLLHDVGKFAQRARVYEGTHAEISAKLATEWKGWLPPQSRESIAIAISQHSSHTSIPKSRLELITQIADQLANGGLPCDIQPKPDAIKTPLISIFSALSLTTQATGQMLGYPLAPLNFQHSFPEDISQNIGIEGYQALWQGFAQDLARFEKSGPVDNLLRFTTLVALLKKHLWCMPSAIPLSDEDDPILPDISLYNHLKITAAIATCLEAGLSDAELQDLASQGNTYPRPIAVIVRGDFSGIQSFIYRITRPETENEFEHVAKRLRGRSFYLSLIGEIVTDFLIRKLGISVANLLFLGGGRFDLIVPIGASTKEKLEEIYELLDRWMLDKFTGDLGLQIATAQVKPSDFGNMQRVYAQLEAALQNEKKTKWKRYLLQENFHISPKDEFHACRVCHTTSLPAPGICKQCESHAELGKKLPHTTRLAFLYGEKALVNGQWMEDFAADFGVRVALLDEGETTSVIAELRQQSGKPAIMLQRLNQSDFLLENMSHGDGMSFRFIANSAPLAYQDLKLPGITHINQGDVLPFEAIAQLSTGTSLIGVLKADIDRLGLLFGEGLEDASSSSNKALIVRFETLSNAIDLFFAGLLNNLCTEVTQMWRDEQSRLSENEAIKWAKEVSNLFYVMYAGGDDLLIVGPWDGILRLAERLQLAWSEYVCHNPNLTISAGIVLVKPHYPVQRFVVEANNAIETAKEAGRDRISVFGCTVPWSQKDTGFSELLSLGYDLKKEIDAGNMPRTLIHDLGRLERQHRPSADGDSLKPMWTPRFYYTLARRLSPEVRGRFGPRLLRAMQNISIPVSYVSLATRKE